MNGRNNYVSEDEEAVQSRTSHDVSSAEVSESSSISSANQQKLVVKKDYSKKFVRLYAGTKFFNMPVTNERFLGHCSVKVNELFFVL